MADRADVVIAGGGPAGLATAVAARLKGLEVIVLDGARPPLDKACGEGLMPDGVAVMESLGVDLMAVDSHPFRGIRYIDDQLSAEGEFPDAPGLGVRRTELHGALRSRAETLGVDLRWGVRVRGIRSELTVALREFAGGRVLMVVPHVVGGSACAATSSSNRGPIWSRSIGQMAARPT